MSANNLKLLEDLRSLHRSIKQVNHFYVKKNKLIDESLANCETCENKYASLK